jgi:hypothetical protein
MTKEKLEDTGTEWHLRKMNGRGTVMNENLFCFHLLRICVIRICWALKGKSWLHWQLRFATPSARLIYHSSASISTRPNLSHKMKFVVLRARGTCPYTGFFFIRNAESWNKGDLSSFLGGTIQFVCQAHILSHFVRVSTFIEAFCKYVFSHFLYSR